LFLVVLALVGCAQKPGAPLSKTQIAEEVRQMSAEERTFLPEAYKQVMLRDIRATDWINDGSGNGPHCDTVLNTVLDADRVDMLEPVAVAARYGDEALDELRGQCRAVPNLFFWGGVREERAFGEHGFRLYELSDEVSLLSLENVRQDIDITWLGQKRPKRPGEKCVPGPYYTGSEFYLGRGTFFRMINQEPLCRVREVQSPASSGYLSSGYRQANYYTVALPVQDFVVLSSTTKDAAYLVVLSQMADEDWIPDRFEAATFLNVILLPTEDFGPPPSSRNEELWPYEKVTGQCEFRKAN
jgi:hypothetical protein